MKALIDGDVVATRAAFAAEKVHYRVYVAGEEDYGVVHSAPSKAELNEWLDKQMEDQDTFIVEREKVYAPVDDARMAAKAIMESILTNLQTDDYVVYIKGGGNFRYKLATIKPYKGNRSPDSYPKYLPDTYEYLEKFWQAEKVFGMEVDDKLGLEQYASYKWTEAEGLEGSTVICSIDKDLKMIPGWHYNLVKNEREWVDEIEAMRNFYRQCVTGDATDNIPGLFTITGSKATKSVLSKLEDCVGVGEMSDYIDMLYQGYEVQLAEIKKLLWICRSMDDIPRLEAEDVPQ